MNTDSWTTCRGFPSFAVFPAHFRPQKACLNAKSCGKMCKNVGFYCLFGEKTSTAELRQSSLWLLFPTTLLHPLDSRPWSLSTAIEQQLKRGRSRRGQAVSKPLDNIFTQGSFPYYVSGGTCLCFSSQLFATVFYCVLTRQVGAEIAPGTRNQQPMEKLRGRGDAVHPCHSPVLSCRLFQQGWEVGGRRPGG